MDYAISLYTLTGFLLLSAALYYLLAKYYKVGEDQERHYRTLNKILRTYHYLLMGGVAILAALSLSGAVLVTAEEPTPCEYQLTNETMNATFVSYEYTDTCTDTRGFARVLFPAIIYIILLPSVFVYGTILVYYFLLYMKRWL